MARLTYETTRCRRTVINAISELRRKGVLRKERRGQGTNAYHINWRSLASKFQEFEERVTSVRFLKTGCKNLHLGSAEPCTSVVQKPAPEPIKRTQEENPCPERVISPSAEITTPLEGKLRGNEEGIHGEVVERPSTNSQPTAKPNVYELIDLQAEKKEAAAVAVDSDLSRHPLFGELLAWPELETHLGDAASAELKEKGSGAKLILIRFVERMATGT